MKKNLLTRDQVAVETTWELSSLFKNEAEFEKELKILLENAERFNQKYQTKLNNPEVIVNALNDYQTIVISLMQTGTYASLASNSDQSSEVNALRQASFNNLYQKVVNYTSFFEAELKENPNEILLEVTKIDNQYQNYINDILREKPHTLNPEVEQALATFQQVFNAPYGTYQRSKLVDLKFDEFQVADQKYPLSFVLFENEWEFEVNHQVRRAAYQSFYEKLADYQQTFASLYQTKVLTEKAEAKLRGFDSVTDYLLFPQKVSSEMYHRQIDLIMEHLAPVMRKFALLLKDIHQLDKLTYADLKLEVDEEFEPNISIQESESYILDGLKILGNDYQAMLKRAYQERWIDFPQNLGKSTGAFCSSPYGVHPYILINWTNKMREVFVLGHELGHAGHFFLANSHQNVYDTRPSLYFIEAPSTMNELIIANHLTSTNSDLRFQRWVKAAMISRTYYHNFVTHLLEAAYQREVYNYVDANKPLSASVLNQLKLDVLKQFWGDTVEIPDYAGLTWMRQPHYYMGLYPYTYSAGLTIATMAYQNLQDKTIEVDNWLEMLKAGGTKDPLSLAQMVKVDLSSEKPLLTTIAYIESLVDDIIALSKELAK